MKTVISICALFFACAAQAERQPLSRYQSVIDRQMFGQPPPGFDPSKPASEVAASSRAEEKALTQEQEKLQSAVQFSIINITPEGETAVGFSDVSDPKAPKHYYLKVGEERDGWLVKDANPAEASMTIAKDEIEVSLKIGENSAKGGTTARSGGGRANVGAAPSRFGGGLRGRRMARLAEQRQQIAADAKKAEEAKAVQEAQEAEREAQRQAEREEQRKQLMDIQEELKRVREARPQQQQESTENAGNDGQ